MVLWAAKKWLNLRSLASFQWTSSVLWNIDQSTTDKASYSSGLGPYERKAYPG